MLKSDVASLSILLDRVHDRESFFTFVRALIADRQNLHSWENTTIEDFLQAALAWAQDSGMSTAQGLLEEPTWKAFAVFLYSGKIYE